MYEHLKKGRSQLHGNVSPGAWKYAESGMLSSTCLEGGEGVCIKKENKIKASEVLHIGL